MTINHIPVQADPRPLCYIVEALRQIVETGIIEPAARLIGVRCEPINVELHRGRSGLLWRIRNECAETFAKCGAFFHVSEAQYGRDRW